MSSPRKCCKTSRPQKITQRPDPAKFQNPQNSINPLLANFSPFSGCSDFLSFMDYKLNDVAISPKELYDGLPKNIQGLSACIELCVLANDFNCLSGFFDTLKGRCLLYNVNSLSNPSAFCKHNGNGHQLYFENGCAESHKDVSE
uniref:Apple domain-containing protein n=1 Tax=Meloidogyne enterolobii TaxID=390850 RepID=A0A6V7TTB1_MELEN|nr:unnamed protein product [Meloidogyne enterolobii]